MYAFFQGKFVPLADAKISIMTHALHYGTGCFEGIRSNWNETEEQLYIFRAADHFRRLHQSAHILHIKIAYGPDELCDIAVELVRRSGLKEDQYLRPLAYKSSEVVANLKAHTLEDDFLMFVVPLGNYLDPSKGVHCATSSWRRIDDMSIPPRAKVTGAYINSVLAKTEAVQSGFDEAILLNADGHVAEGTGENLFLVIDGKLITPGATENVLKGITRDTVIELAREELGIETEERPVDRTELYIADESFLTGTAAHLTPVTKVDHRNVGDGEIGPITKRLQDLYFDVIRGKNKKYIDWCLPVLGEDGRGQAGAEAQGRTARA
ncbi:MAG: branched-chain amino acid transaminase [Chloroflexi bacterium]|nr:branched-chain amino acid transaminase [Chloroflexota bacterium]MCI0768883.1 branched-chain amino acid transaminase [Chloroflexota bacterium]